MMVFQSERVPLSRILSQLYLGAESDITQDCLSARGISYVVSVSRCCPEPWFLPRSQFLRIPIDDSLRDELLPWIPQALRFIDSAISLGCSVIVHCAAGISRSPALAVAYIMYRLEMDLDHAYRFVKERRPTISPNFNFLGQLQLFQHTLPVKCADSNTHSHQPITLANSSSSTVLITQDTYHEVKGHDTDQDIRCPVIQTEFTLSLSDKLRTLTLSTEPSHTHTPQKPTHLHIPSLSEKRKSLTLSLTPLGLATNAHTHAKAHTPATAHTNQQREMALTNSGPCSFPAFLKGETRALDKDVKLCVCRGACVCRGTCVRCTRTQKRRCEEKTHRMKEEQASVKSGQQRRERRRTTASSHTLSVGTSTSHQQEVTGSERSDGAVEVTDGDHNPASRLHFTINRLLEWGEGTLLRLILTPHIKVDHAALSYRC